MLTSGVGLLLLAVLAAPPDADGASKRLVGKWKVDGAALLELIVAERPGPEDRAHAREEVEKASIVLEVTADRLTWKVTGEKDKVQTYRVEKAEPQDLVLDATETIDAWGGKGLETHEALTVHFVDADTIHLSRGEEPRPLTVRRLK